jgi:superfamily II DNA or RNA helicase
VVLVVTYDIIKYFNYGIISPAPQGTLATALSKRLSYEKKGIEYMPNRAWGIVKFYNPTKGTFPWGLLSVVENVFEQYNDAVGNVQLTVSDLHTIQRGRSVVSTVLRPYQVEAVEALLMRNGGILNMPTGSGKTITAVEYLRIMKLPTLIVVTTLDIKRQWVEDINGLPYTQVVNYQNKQAVELAKTARIVVFDECHHASCKSIYKIAMATKTDTVLVGLSGTPYREDGEGMRMHAALGDIVYSVSRSSLIEAGYLSNAVVYYTDAPYTPEKYLSYADEYRRYIVENDARNAHIARIVRQQVGRVLVLVTHIEHGRRLQELLPDAVFLNGSVKDRSVDFSKTSVIIASAIFNEGVNLPSLDVLVLAGAGKSGIQLTQRVGRVLRTAFGKKHAVVYDFKDRGKYLGAHYRARRALLTAEFGVVDI